MSSSAPSPSPPNIGDKLKVARLDRRLSLEESAWRTRIRPDLLRALEEDSYEALGHEAFVRSHLTSYARFLGIDPGEVVRAFDASRDEPSPSALEELGRAERESRKPPRARWLLAAILSLGVLVGGAVLGVLGGQAERVSDDVPVPVARPQSSPVPAAEARVRLQVAALAETHVSILIDGVDAFEGIMPAGLVRTFRARETLEIIAANGAAVELSLNGVALGVPGVDDEVFRQRYGPDGPLAPAG